MHKKFYHDFQKYFIGGGYNISFLSGYCIPPIWYFYLRLIFYLLSWYQQMIINQSLIISYLSNISCLWHMKVFTYFITANKKRLSLFANVRFCNFTNNAVIHWFEWWEVKKTKKIWEKWKFIFLTKIKIENNASFLLSCYLQTM